jgi:hypothetical protein
VENVARNPLVAACAEILVTAIKCAAQDPEAIAATRVLFAPPAAPPPAEPEGLLSPAELARALHVSPATVGRLDGEGMPHVIVGTRKRYALDACRSWLAARGSRPTRAKPSDNVNIDSVCARAGLRLPGGSHR